ncbi:MAG: 6-carboxytetrahydropterin synthase [Acidobacteriota bacterium]
MSEFHPSTPAIEGGVYTLLLAKEDFKFSCGHFTLFGPDVAEMMHGHNYHVAVELTGEHLDDEELLASFVDVKRAVRAACARLDSLTLIPQHSPHLSIETDGTSVDIHFSGKHYRLPAEDVLLLPLRNTSIEALAMMLWRELVDTVDARQITRLGVEVSETAGQSCWFRAPMPPSPPPATPIEAHRGER